MNKNLIVASLAKQVYAYLNSKSCINYGLLGGDFGAICFLYYYSHIDKAYQSCADAVLQKMLVSLPMQPLRATYCDGLAGLGIGLKALENDGFVSGIDSSLTEFDGILYRMLIQDIRKHNIDFLHGMIGMGFYFAMRCKCGYYDRNIDSLGLLVDYLYSNAVKEYGSYHGPVFSWRLPDKEDDREYNISLSHGCASIAIMLCEFYRLDISEYLKRKVCEMIVGIKNYLLTQELDPKRNFTGSHFPNFSKEYDDNLKFGSRLAWCYGDLGICISLIQMSDVLHDKTLENKALDILSYSAASRRDFTHNYVRDAEICHGAAGIGQIFRAMYQKEATANFKSAATYWYDTVLSMYTSESGDITYLTYNADKQIWTRRCSLLEGIPGIGLYLLHADSFLNQVLIIQR